MKPLSLLGEEEARCLRGVLFDLDDTLLSHGVLTSRAYAALWSLGEARLALVAVTGRPSGWGEVLVRQWPIDGCIAENGAVHLIRRNRGIERVDACEPNERRSRQHRLSTLVERVREVVPEARLSDDAGARLSDVTWDIGEQVTLPADRVGLIVREIALSGARSTQSTVHLHATFDVDDKATGAIRFCARQLEEEPSAAVVRYAFIGDSENDAACFAAFRTTFGVANVRASLGRLTVTPRYVATREMGDGFAEIATEILEKRTNRDVRAQSSQSSQSKEVGTK